MNNNILSSTQAIIGLHTTGFVAPDGAKLASITVEYSIDLSGAIITPELFTVETWAGDEGNSKCELGSDPGKVLRAYIADTGRHIVLEVNTDYQFAMGAPSYQLAMHAGVRQVDVIKTDNCTITPGGEINNYDLTLVETFHGSEQHKLARPGTFTIQGVEGYQIFTRESGTAFHAPCCFEEATGEYIDVDIPYALFVPADYDAAKKYALVLHIHDAGYMGTDPMITLTQAQGPVNFASTAVQQILKGEGLAGLIAVAPQIDMPLRSTRDNWTVSAAVPAVWQLLDHLTEAYSVDPNRIYATGQSMGAMQSLAMAAQRDNYFAGILAIGCQWGTNYNKEVLYQGQPYYPSPADGKLIWTADADGNPCDYQNWFHMISDDNILIASCTGDGFATGVWKELEFLYADLAGATIPKATWNPLTLSKDEQCIALTELVNQKNTLGFYWIQFEGGNHMATWTYCHGIFAAYEWLFKQTRQSEMSRPKLPLDRPFETTEQIRTPNRLLGVNDAGENIYFLTGKPGTGTADYNTTTYGRAGKLLTWPNWKPEEL